MATEGRRERHSFKSEALLALAYYALYVGYLFVHQENEIAHWVTLVVLPLTMLCLFQRRAWDDWSVRASLGTVGLERGQLARGLVWAVPLGLAISLILQLFLSRDAETFRELISSGKAFYLAPLVFLFLLLTTGVTEEFFFRGVLQTRLVVAFRSKVVGVLATSILFGLYHVPYAYLNPNWPSHGDLGAALQAGLANGFLGGVVLGGVYVMAGGNLIAPIIVHALIDVFPAMTQIRFG
ncbi:MAG: CPBP family intramembrane metalloprotease [Gemmatimonadales bacterium]